MDPITENLSDRCFVRLRPSTARQLLIVAAEEKRDKSEVIRLAIEEYLERRERAKVLEPARQALMAGAR